MPPHRWCTGPAARAVFAALIAAMASLAAGPGSAQDVDEDLWVTDGTVNAIVRDGDTIYIGGSFTRVDPATGGGLPLDATTGTLLGLPAIVGFVNAVAPDGSGGWYVGGRFTHVGGQPRSNIAHILADHTVSTWNPDADDVVSAIAVSGGIVYVGGVFGRVGGEDRAGLAALDAITGAATGWDPDPDVGVVALAVDGATVFAGGAFTMIGGTMRPGIAALDATTGEAMPWSPWAEGRVLALALDAGTLYAGGDFLSLNGQTRHRIAALDAATGLVTAWDPDVDGTVRALAVSGGTVYAGGSFSHVGGAARSGIAAIDAATGAPTAWDPNADGTVNALAVGATSVYAAGGFDGIGGETRRGAAMLDAATGLATPWNSGINGYAYALAVSGSTVFVGGEFTGAGGTKRNGIAALDATTGIATSWNPEADGTVYVLAVDGGTVYAGGSFTAVGGQPRNRIAAIDSATGQATAWDPDANGTVRALVVRDGTVYAGGSFGVIGGQPRNRIAALDAGSGLATSWNPGANNTVYALALGWITVYAGGAFTTIGGQPRNRIAELDVVTGLATAWNPDADYDVYALLPRWGNVYAGGNFASIGGAARHRIAALDATAGIATSWNPEADGTVYVLAVDGGTVYAGGTFRSVDGLDRRALAALDAGTGLATAWNPRLVSQIGEGSGDVRVLALAAGGGLVHAGGVFTGTGAQPRSFLAGLTQGPAIWSSVPDAGGDDGSVTATIHGVGFQSGASARLEGPGQPDIVGTRVTVSADGRRLTATFDLIGAAHGARDVVVANPDLKTATLPGGFTIGPGEPQAVRVDIAASGLMRPDRRHGIYLWLDNMGNIDITGMPLWISGIPEGASVTLDFPLAAPPRDEGEPDWGTVPLTFSGPEGRYLVLVIPVLPPGVTGRRLFLSVPATVPEFELDVALVPPWTCGDALRECLSGAGVIASPACAGSQLAAIDGYLTATPGIEALSGIGVWTKIAWACEGAASLEAALLKAGEVLGYMRPQPGGPPTAERCEIALVPRWEDRLPVTMVTSVDPNDKLGTNGAGAARLVARDERLPYLVHFENLETAPVSAQQVLVTDPLEPELDPETVSLALITFGEHTVFPPPGCRIYATDVDLRPQQDLIVRVGIGIDVATGVLNWSLTSIDPLTGRIPEDPSSGFLPPNVTPLEGEGSALFTVMPTAGLPGGTTIRNSATLDFDGAPLQTPEWTNVLDGTVPASHVLPLPGTQDSASFTVRWEPDGSSADLRDYSVYVSEDGGAYWPWRLHVSVTADTIRAPGGKTYAFFSLARDSSGNLEEPPATPDAQTYSVAAVAPGGGPCLALQGAIPNPAVGTAQVWFTLPDRQRTVLEVMDVAGRRLLRRDVGALGPGRHVVDVGAEVKRPGLYFLRLVRGAETLRARMVVLR